jgi:predicted RecA/RadA family phage recombinase
MSNLTRKQEGDAVYYTPSAAVVAGVPTRLPDGRVGIPPNAVAASVEGSFDVRGVFQGDTASAATWNAGDKLAWDASASQLVKAALTLDGDADLIIGTAGEAQVSGATTGTVLLNEGPRNYGLQVQQVVYEFDCETGVDSTAHVLIPSEQNPHGLLLLGAYAIVTEVFAGSTQDQGIVTIQDEDDTAICTLTASDAAADAVNDIIVGTSDIFGATSGDAAKVVAAGKDVEGIVSQATSGGTPAGKMKVFLLFMPLL